jgi:hypothetical protein
MFAALVVVNVGLIAARFMSGLALFRGCPAVGGAVLRSAS